MTPSAYSPAISAAYKITYTCKLQSITATTATNLFSAMHNRLLDPEPDMPDHIGFDPKLIFNVEGMVVVITGGGTGSIPSMQYATVLVYSLLLGIGLMMATVLEHNGATVYIVGRRRAVLEKAAKENSVSKNHLSLLSWLPDSFVSEIRKDNTLDGRHY